MSPPAKFRPRLLLLWALVFIVAAMLDSTCAVFAKGHGTQAYLESHRFIRELIKAFGNFKYLALIPVLLLMHPTRWRASLLFVLAALLIATNDIIKWIVGRTRPFRLNGEALEPFSFQPFRGGLTGAFHTSNLCFPSGHAALAFASAATLSILLPRWRWVFYAIAAIVAAERVLEDAHWLSDTVGAAAMAVGGVWVIRKLWWDKREGSSGHGLPVLIAGDTSLQ